MRRTLHSLCLAGFVCIFWLTPAIAQVEKGSISGTVQDSTNAVLPGARVELQPTGQKIVSDGQGQFKFPGLAPGEYTLTSTYVGFSTFTATVTVKGGEVANVDAVLKIGSQSDEIIVTAERLHGEAEAINIERTAENIVQVLPSKVINSLPNTNVADAVGRLPSVTLERDEGEGKYVQIRGTEPRLSNVTVNGVNVPSPEGNVRNIKLDVLPADLVDRIEVNKTLSANQDGDAIGGSVNLVTKTPGDKAAYSFGGQGGYTPIQGGRPLTAFNGTAGKRFGANKKLGILFGGTYDYNARGIDDLEPTQAIGNFNGQNVALVSSQDLRSYSYYRTRYGFAGGIDYNLTEGSNIYVKGLYSDFHDFGETWVYTPNYGNTIKSVNGPQITFNNGLDCQAINQVADTDPTQPQNPCQPGFMQYRHYVRRPDQQIFSILTGGRHDLSSTLITYEVSGSRAHNIGGQDFPTTRFIGPQAQFDAAGNLLSPGVDLALNKSNPLRPQFNALDHTNLLNPATYSLTDTVFPQYRSTQLNFQGAASLAQRYHFGSHYGTLEFGAKIRDAYKTQSENDRFFSANNPGDPTLALSNVLGTYTNSGYYDHTYQFGPNSDYKKIDQLIRSNLQSSFTENTDKNRIVSDPATWDTSERVYAGYVMNSIGFGRLRLQTGVRFEATDSSFNANRVTLNNGAFVSTTPVKGTGGYFNTLPSVQAQYLIGQNTTVRAAFGVGIARPNFGDLVPSVQVDPNTSPKSLQLGNPNLKPTRANNYDVLVEHFFQPLGILQGGFFYKSLTNPIYPTVVILPPGDPFAGFQQQQSINGPSAHIAGFEAAWEQRLSRLPGLLSGFGVAANYSYTTSRVTFPAGFSGGRIDHPTLQRQAPNTWNLGMTYDKARFSMRFGVSHNDANLFAYGFVHDPKNPGNDGDPIVGIKGPLGDQYLYAHTQYDVQGSYRLVRGWRIVASGLNLSNEVFGFYTGSPIYPNQREYYKPTVTVGMRWSSGAE
jgi:TonB-dependent receptor